MAESYQQLKLHAMPQKMNYLKKAEKNLLTMIQHGVLAVESKSGYGLDKENELKQLKVSNRLAEKYNLDMKHTFLGPHAVPKDAESNQAFLQEMIDLLPEVKSYADFADIFCETGVFTVEESKKYMQAAKEQRLCCEDSCR
ncbi:imidazolonepropionase [Staphylococcus gallinarum]|uniref:Imidazolonepropionase n=1 Tax=Staphylococcus gallinarum TaxID=1293 RepID=A0A380FLG3_STAGA|nr:imidazolonepropionase [Staphylococcus gallinarum]